MGFPVYFKLEIALMEHRVSPDIHVHPSAVSATMAM
jgi:hypothetical protein